MGDVEYWNPQKAMADAISGVHIKSVTIVKSRLLHPNRFLVSSMRFTRGDNEYLAKCKHGIWNLKTMNKHGAVFTKDDVNFFRITLRVPGAPRMIVSDVVDASVVKVLMNNGTKIKIKRS